MYRIATKQKLITSVVAVIKYIYMFMGPSMTLYMHAGLCKKICIHSSLVCKTLDIVIVTSANSSAYQLYVIVPTKQFIDCYQQQLKLHIQDRMIWWDYKLDDILTNSNSHYEVLLKDTVWLIKRNMLITESFQHESRTLMLSDKLQSVNSFGSHAQYCILYISGINMIQCLLQWYLMVNFYNLPMLQIHCS